MVSAEDLAVERERLLEEGSQRRLVYERDELSSGIRRPAKYTGGEGTPRTGVA